MMGMSCSVTIQDLGVGAMWLRTTSSVFTIMDLPYFYHPQSGLFFEHFGIGIPRLMGTNSSVTLWDLGAPVIWLRTTSSVCTIVDLPYFYYLRFGLFLWLCGIGIVRVMGISGSVTIGDLAVGIIWLRTTNSMFTIMDWPYFYYARFDLFFKIFGIGIACQMGISIGATT